jgi:hypothetical protein
MDVLKACGALRSIQVAAASWHLRYPHSEAKIRSACSRRTVPARVGRLRAPARPIRARTVLGVLTSTQRPALRLVHIHGATPTSPGAGPDTPSADLLAGSVKG